MPNCNICNDTGWIGDNCPGFDNNSEVHPCDYCQKGKLKQNAVNLLGYDVAKDLTQLSSFYNKIKKLEKQNQQLYDQLCDAKGWARTNHVNNVPKHPKSFTPSHEDIYKACLSFRHDFELLSKDEQNIIENEACDWFNAWKNTITKYIK